MTSPDPLTIPYPSNASWTIYGSSPRAVYAQPKFIPYPLFISIHISVWRIRHAKGKETEQYKFRPGIISDSESANALFYQRILSLLTTWSNSIPNFQPTYKGLPFYSSSIQITNATGPNNLIPSILNGHTPFTATIHPSYRFERQLRSSTVLRNIWGATTPLPPIIPLTSLHLHTYLHDTVALVSIPSSNTPYTLYAFKTNRDPPTLYQELHTLLTLPPHPHTLSSPPYLITTPTLHSLHHPNDPASHYLSLPNHPIIGFLTPYHPHRISRISPTPHLQASWSTQLTSALLHIQRAGRPGVYTNLKMDNIVLSSSHSVILLDFENGSNWPEYTAPEIGGRGGSVARREWEREGCHRDRSALLGRRNSSVRYSGGWRYGSVFWGRKGLTDGERESAMVWALGCCLLCVLDGRACMRDDPGARARTGVAECVWRNREKYGIPREVRDVVERCFEKKPGERPRLEEVWSVLEGWQRSLELGERGKEKVEVEEVVEVVEEVRDGS